MDAVKIIEILKVVRAEQQLSQGDIAEKTGIARTYISRVENFKLDPRLSTLERIASLGLGASLDEIIHAYRSQHNGARGLAPAPVLPKGKPRKSGPLIKKMLQDFHRLVKEMEGESNLKRRTP